MLESIINFSIRQKLVVAIGVSAVAAAGIWAFTVLPIEAFPDVLNESVQVITQLPGQSAEDVERKVTQTLEREFTGIPKVIQTRSVSEFGLSVIYLTFDDGVDKYWARSQTLEKIQTANLAQNIQPQLAPMASVTGEILRYELRGANQTDISLRSLEDGTLEKQLRSVPGVADVTSYGGKVRNWDVLIDPLKLANYGITIRQVADSIQNSNVNAGGNMIHWPNQSFVVRSLGEFKSRDDLEHVGIGLKNDSVLAVRDVGQVLESHLPERGIVGRDDKDNIVQGIVLLRKGENPVVVGHDVKKRVDELNHGNLLPIGVKLYTYYDRMKLVDITTRTVWKNLAEGLLLVIIILFVFLQNIYATIIVALIVPLSLLFAFLMIVLFHTPANLISLGAIDFGMVVDGAVLIVESVLCKWALAKVSRQQDESIEKSVAQIIRPVFFSMVMIILAYLPIFTLQRVEGKMFAPLAWTVSFTLTGALLLSLILIPALLPWLKNKFDANHDHQEPQWLQKLKVNYLKKLKFFIQAPQYIVLSVILILTLTGIIFKFTGTEFLPELDEGALWIRASYPHSTSLEEGVSMTRKIREIIKSQDEVKTVVSQLGGPEDGTDPNLFDNCEFFVDLKSKKDWNRFSGEREKLIENLRGQLEKLPGIEFNISQPIADNVEEAISGVKGKNAVKIFGPDLDQLKKIATELISTIKMIPGTTDVAVTAATPMVPHLTIKVNRTKVAQVGLNSQDVNDLVEIAVGGKTVTQVYDGEKRLDVIVRAPEYYRNSLEAVKSLPLTLPTGKRIFLRQVADVTMESAPQAIFRENGSRRIAVKFNVVDRDLGSVMKEIVEKMAALKVPTGYQLEIGGEYENQKRAMNRLLLAVPATILILAVILFMTLKNIKVVWAVLINMLLSATGGILLLFIRGIPFSVSAGVGLLALLGVTSLNSVTLMSQFVLMREQCKDKSLLEIIETACETLFRPIIMTAALAALAILPAALSHEMGSETQRPLATMVIGGLMTALPSTLFVLPVMVIILEQGRLKALALESMKCFRDSILSCRRFLKKQ
jgi:cobalt-zinc-cadmium resistance protein CzcA